MSDLYIFLSIALIVLFSFGLVLLPAFVRGKRMHHLARTYGLTYQRTTRSSFWYSLWHPIKSAQSGRRGFWKEHLISGSYNGHAIEVFDSFQLATPLFLMGQDITLGCTYILIDGTRREVKTHFPWRRIPVWRIGTELRDSTR